MAELTSQVVSLRKDWPIAEADVAGLDVFYLPTRYPDALPGGLPADAFGEDDAHRALERSERVIEAATTALSTDDSSVEDTGED